MATLSSEALDAIKARIADCRTYNFGMWNADRLAHEDAPALVAEIERLTGRRKVAHLVIVPKRHEAVRPAADSAPTTRHFVHNHGTEDGPGLACRERLVNGLIYGACLPDPTTVTGA